jgi:Na+-driven multidrug efflux pump
VISYSIYILTIIFPAEILGMYAKDDELIRVGLPYLRAFSFDYLLVPIAFSMNGLFIGAGHTTYSLFSNILSGIIVRMPLAFLFSSVLGLGLFGVGLAVPMATLSSILLNLWFFLSGRWKVQTIHLGEHEDEEKVCIE